MRSLRQVGDLMSFQSFLRVLASRNSQLFNLTDVARDLGVAANSAQAWLSAVEVTFQVIVLRPYHANIRKRLVKTPKIYITDTGTLCYLTGLRDPEHAMAGPMGGTILEIAVLIKIVKTMLARGEEPRICFWRTSAGVEVNLIEETGGKPVEIKLSSTPLPAMASSIQTFRADLKRKAGLGYVVHGGEVRLPLGPSVTAIPFAEL